jgi:hypothetical protein
MIRCGSDQTYVKKGGGMGTMIRCGFDQTNIKKRRRNGNHI